MHEHMNQQNVAEVTEFVQWLQLAVLDLMEVSYKQLTD
jgi:hypothetical protein